MGPHASHTRQLGRTPALHHQPPYLATTSKKVRWCKHIAHTLLPLINIISRVKEGDPHRNRVQTLSRS